MSGFRRREAATLEKIKRSRLSQATKGAPVNESRYYTSGRTSIISRGRVHAFLGSIAITVLILFSRSSEIILPESYALCSRDGANIYTVEASNPRVECLVVHDAYVIDTGTVTEVQGRWPKSVSILRGVDEYQSLPSTLRTRYIKRGSIVVPGLSDSHAHILEYGASRQLPLEGAENVQDAVSRVKKYILSNNDVHNDTSKFIEGWGWDQTYWPNTKWPDYTDLERDPVISGRPVVLQSKDGHALWVSAKVIELMSPFPETVEGGAIFRDSFGRPTGVFVDNAQDLIKKPLLTDEDLLRRFSATVQDALARGLTTIHDAGFDPVSLAFFRREAAKGRLPIRIYGMTYFDEDAEYWGHSLEKVIADGNGTLTARSVKIFADGALRSSGAALYEPYEDQPETNGFLRLTPERLNSVIPRFLRDGWQVNVHAIGDRANGVVLDAFEAALKGVNVTALRPRLEHAQIMTDADMARVAKLGVIASVQPTHVISDMWYAQDRLGPERVKGLYAFRSLVDNGARITLGSDFPVEDINPLKGFYAAITRLSPDGKSPHGTNGWFPEQRLTRDEALRGMTIDPSYASFTEAALGSLIPGKLADYVVLSQDIMTIPPHRILSTEVIATVMEGRPVYGTV